MEIATEEKYEEDYSCCHGSQGYPRVGGYVVADLVVEEEPYYEAEGDEHLEGEDEVDLPDEGFPDGFLVEQKTIIFEFLVLWGFGVEHFCFTGIHIRILKYV